jgi:hypothetical protein
MTEDQIKILQTAPEFVQKNLKHALSYAEEQSRLVDFHLTRIGRISKTITKIGQRRRRFLCLNRRLKNLHELKNSEMAEAIYRHKEHCRVMEYLKKFGPLTAPFRS